MKAKNSNYLIRHLMSLATPALMMTLFSPAQAQNRFWDGGTANIAGNGNGASAGGTGNWNTTLTNWDQGSGLAMVAWNNANLNTAVFAGTAGTVTINAPVSAGGLTFTTTGYTLAGGASPNNLTLGGTSATITTSALTTAGTTTISSIISGNLTGGLTIASNGDMTASGGGAAGRGVIFSGTNTFTGNITVTSGLFNPGANATLGNAANTITLNGGGLLANVTNTISRNVTYGTSNGTIRVYGAQTLTMSGVQSGTGTLTKTDTGILIFNNTGNNRSGATTIASGELRAVAPTTAGAYTILGSGAVTANSGTTLRFFTGSTAAAIIYANAINLNGATLINEDGNHTLTGAIALTGTNTINGVWGEKNLTLSGVVSGAGNIIKSGAARLILTGANTYSGTTTINAGSGALQVGDGSTTGALGTGAVTNNASLIFNRGNAMTVASVISGTGSITQSGAGTTSLTAANTFSGGTTLAAGGLSISNATGFGSGSVTITSTTGTTITVANNAATTVANNFVLPAPVTAQNYNIIKNTASATTGTELTLSGVISGGGANAKLLLNSSTGGDTTTTYRLSNTNTFTGSVQIFRGGVIVTNQSSLGASTNVLELNSNNSPLGDLRFESGFTLPNPVSLLLPATISSNGFSAALSGAVSGSSALNKVGAGSLTLSGANTAAGAMTVSAGTLSLDYSTQDNSKLSDTASLTLAAGTSLNLTSTAASTHVETIASTTINGSVSITRSGSSLNKIALGAITNVGGALAISADNVATTTVDMTNGLLPAYISVNGSRATKDLDNNILAYTGFTDVDRLGGSIADAPGADIRIVEAGTSGNVTLAASGTTTVGTIFNAGTVAPTLIDLGEGSTLRLNDLGTIAAGVNGLTITNGAITAGGVADTAGTLDLFNDSAIVTTIGSSLADNGAGVVGLAKSGTGVVVLSGANTYSGATTINGGTLALAGGSAISNTGDVILSNTGAILRVDANETIGSLTTSSPSTVNLQANALTVSTTTNTTVAGIIAGTGGSLVKDGPGTLTLIGANTYTGGTTVTAGVLNSRFNTTQNSIGTGAASIASGATLSIDNTNTSGTTPVFANTMTGSGLLRVTFAANTTARNTTISGVAGFAGTIQLSNLGANGDKWSVAGLTSTASVVVDSGSQLFPNTTASSFAGGITLSGTGNSENRGAVRLGTTLGGNVTLLADTTIGGEGGTLTGAISGGAASAMTMTLGTANSTTGSTLSGNISNGTATSLSITALNGTNTLSGSNSYTGATTVTAGTFNILGTQTGGGAVNVNGTSTLNLAGAVTGSTVTMAAGTTLRGEGSAGALTYSGAGTLLINPATTEALTLSGALTMTGATTVNFAGGAPTSGAIRVMNFGSTTANAANFVLANSSNFRSPSFTVNATNVELSLGNTDLTWTGTGGTNWNVNTTTNWNNTVPAAATFFFGDAVTFNDSPGANQTVNMAVDVQPSSVTFNNSTISYALVATTGRIIGTTGITKNGTNNVTLGGANGQNYTGLIAVNAGSLTMGSRDAFGLSSGISIASEASVNINDQTPGAVTTGGYTYTIQGTGVANAGAIHNTTAVPAGVASNAGVRTLNLAGNASIGGTSRFDIGFANTAGTGGINGNGFTLTKVGTNPIHARGPATNVNYVVNEGTLGFENVATASGTNDIVVNSPGKVAVVGALTLPNNVTVNTGGTIAGFTTAGGVWSGNIALASGSNIEAGADFSISGTATLDSSGSLNKVGGSQCAITGFLVGSGGVLNHNAGTIQIGNLGATGSITGFPTINLGNGVLFRNRLTTVNNTISSNFNFANASAEVRQHGALTTDTLTLTGTVGTSTVNGILRTTFGRMVLGSGASSTVNMVAIQGAPASGPGVIEVATGATLTSPWFNIGQDSSNSGILSVTGGTVTALTGGGGGNNAVRIGHWNNNSATVPSQLNVSAGLFDASAANLTTFVGWDGFGTMTVGGGASAATARVTGLQLDGNGDSPTYNDTATMLPNGTLEVGTGGIAGASTNDFVILGGGTIRGVANSTWSARMDATAATTSFLAANTGVIVTQSGSLTGTGTIEKTGAGILQATGGVFPGTLTSSGGALHLGSTAWTGSTFLLRSAAGGVIQPGTPSTAASVTVNALTFNGGTPTFRANFNGGAFGDRFLVSSTDGFRVDAPTALTVIPGSDLFLFDKIPLIDYNGTIGGTEGFAGLTATAAGNPHYILSLENDEVNTVVNVVIEGLDSVVWKGSVNGTWDVNTTANWETLSDAQASNFYSLDAVRFNDDGAAAPLVTLAGTINPSSVQFDAVADYTLQGDPIIGSGTFQKFNTGTVTLLNNNTYTGAVTINGGSVRVGNGGTTGALGGSGNISIGTSGTLEISRSDAQTLTRTAIGGGTLVKSGTGTLTVNSANHVVDFVVNEGTFAPRGGAWATSFAANRTITVNTGGTLDTTTHALGGLGGATRPNNIVINEDAIWKLNNEQQLPNTALTLNAGIVNGPGDVRGGGTIATIAHATKSSVINAPISTGNGGVTFNTADGDVAVDLSVTGAIVGGNVITKIGAGTMVPSGNNSYTGGTALNGGVLVASTVADAGGVGSIGVYTSGSPGYLGIANDATFRYTGTGTETTARNLWIDTGTQNKTIDVVSATASLTFSGTAGNINKPFTKAGLGTLTLVDDIVTDGAVTVSAGRLILTGNNSHTGVTTITGGSLEIGSGGSAGTLGSGAVTNNASLIINLSAALTVGNVISGTGTLTQSGSGTTTLVGNNDYSGSTVISSGALEVGAGGTAGTLGSGAVTNNTSLTFNRSDALTVANEISGTGTMTKNAAGTLTMTGSSSYSGATTVAAGTLLANNTSGSATGTSAVSVSAGAVLGGTGSISGTVAVAGTGSIAPGVTIGQLTTGALTLAGTYTCDVDATSSDVLAVNGNIDLTGATLTMSGAMTASSYTIATYTGTRTGTFTLSPALPAGYEMDYSTAGVIKIAKSGYNSWASINAPTGQFNDDFDGDGVSNGIEFVVGGTKDSNDGNKLPQVTTDGSNLIFTFIRSKDSITPEIAVAVQVDTDLEDWPTSGANYYAVPSAPVVNTPGLSVVDNAPANDQTITLTVPMGTDTKKFARLSVTVAAP